MKQRRLHTYVKCNPTLLGPDRVRGILHDDLGYTDVIVPDEAFEHDLAYDDAVPLLDGLRTVAADCGLDFGVKLTNTLQVENFRSVFSDSERLMYLSGRPLHAITVNLAADLAEEFSGDLPMSFSAGADCFKAPLLLAAGMQTVTVCSDLLKTGGYLRLLQYLENSREAFARAEAASIGEYIQKMADTGSTGAGVKKSAQLNLRQYARLTCQDQKLKKGAFYTARSKTGRKLDLFDCIGAPCVDQCPVDQKVPHYIQAVREDDLKTAIRLTRSDNPVASMLGRVCDHLCEPVCIRTHLDEPLAIRHIKRFIMGHEKAPALTEQQLPLGIKVAIIGAGPGGMAAASELARAGCNVEIFEMHPYAGGMVGGAIPEYRLPAGVIERDLAVLESLRVKIHYNMMAGRDIHLSQLRRSGFHQVIITVGAQLGKKLGLDDEDCEGVLDALHFLRQSREGDSEDIGRRIGIIGAGDTAMDCARTAWRLTEDQPGARVHVIYRRTIDQMPADREEVKCLLEEGIDVIELARPQQLLVENGKLRSLLCRRMEYRGDRDASGRKIPHDAPGSDFEIPLDTLILAISQHAILDFFGKVPVAVNHRGYIEVDPLTFETSVSGVYAGGDVVNDGPSSIVEAAADGKAIARAILGRPEVGDEAESVDVFDTVDLLRRRSHREWRVPVPHSPVEERKNFAEVVRGYTALQARTEAARCLDCNRYCSLCVGVCPNLALQTIQVDPGEHPDISQVYQVVVLTDLCNECGNCTTFCPTAGEPYRDKPRLYLDRDEFEAQQDNAFMVFRGPGLDGTECWSMDARWNGEDHHMELAGFDGDADLNLPEPYSSMLALLQGLRCSASHLPAAVAGDHIRPQPSLQGRGSNRGGENRV
jgi:putative selenate reductase